MKSNQEPHLGKSSFLALCLAEVSALLMSGCASVPDVSVAYRPVTWQVAASVVHTITCTRDGSRAIIARDGSFTPVYKADATAEPLKLRLKDLDRFFADSDLSVAFTDDGRLKSVNQSTAGQGETIAKSLVSTVATLGTATLMKGAAPDLVIPAGAAAAKDNKTFLLSNSQLIEIQGRTPDPICKVVNDWSAAAAPKELPQIAVVQAGVLVSPTERAQLLVAGNDQSSVLLQALSPHIDLRAVVSAEFADNNKAGLQPVIAPEKLRDDEVGLPLQQTRSFTLKALPAQPLKADDVIKKSTLTVPRPVADGVLTLPIPKAALFGKQTFQLALADSGRITSLGYGRTAGASGALNAVGSLAGEQTAADTAEAAALKAAADLIAQQARLSSCVLKPTDCK